MMKKIESRLFPVGLSGFAGLKNSLIFRPQLVVELSQGQRLPHAVQEEVLDIMYPMGYS